MNGINKISFIGTSLIVETIISGLLQAKQIKNQQINVMDRENDESLHKLKTTYGIKIIDDYERLLERTNVIVLAMESKALVETLQLLKPFINEEQLIISILADVSTKNISILLDKKIATIRAKLNDSATIGLSATSISKGLFVTNDQVAYAKMLFETTGSTTLVEEEQLHIATALSESGPAYIYYLVEAMERAAKQTGLERETAQELIFQTLIGAAEMLKHSPKTATTLRKDITSPNGTTEAGLKVLASYNFQEAMLECIKQAAERSKELEESFTKVIMNELV